MDTENAKKIDVNSFEHLSDFINYKRNLNAELYNKISQKEQEKQEIRNYDILEQIQNQNNEEKKIYKSFDDVPVYYSAGPKYVVKEYIIDNQPLDEAPGPNLTPEEEIKDIFAVKIDDPRRLARLRILYDNKGVVYRFNRGISVIGPDGRKIDEIFDRTPNHHTPTLARIAKDEFGIDVLYDSIHPALFETAIDARNKGITALCFEGGSCSIYLPDDVTVEIIDKMLEEIEPRKNFVFICIMSLDKMVDVTWEEITRYLKGLRAKKEREEAQKEKLPEEEIIPQEKVTNTSINEYINAVLSYIDAKNISLLEYYRIVGRQHRVRDVSSLPEFEQENPIIDENDIRLLQERKDDKIVEYFARAMFKLINKYVAKDYKNRVTIEGKYTGYPNYEKPSNKEQQKQTKQQNQPKQPISIDKISKEDYIKEVLKFISEKNINLMDYYRNVGSQHRVGEADKLPYFELRNPFLDEHDIKLLKDRKDDKIVEYFARAMFKVVNINIERIKHQNHKSNPEEKKTISQDTEERDIKKQNSQKRNPNDLIEMFKKEKTHEYSITEEISFDNLDEYDGYVTIRDGENINIYTYNKDKKT